MWQPITTKNGRSQGRQLYKCHACGRQFLGRKDTFSPVANVVMDTTYFGRKFGVMVFKNTLDGAVLLIRYVKTETVTFYLTKKPKLPTAIALRALSLRLVGSTRAGFAKELAEESQRAFGGAEEKADRRVF